MLSQRITLSCYWPVQLLEGGSSGATSSPPPLFPSLHHPQLPPMTMTDDATRRFLDLAEGSLPFHFGLNQKVPQRSAVPCDDSAFSNQRCRFFCSSSSDTFLPANQRAAFSFTPPPSPLVLPLSPHLPSSLRTPHLSLIPFFTYFFPCYFFLILFSSPASSSSRPLLLLFFIFLFFLFLSSFFVLCWGKEDRLYWIILAIMSDSSPVQKNRDLKLKGPNESQRSLSDGPHTHTTKRKS